MMRTVWIPVFVLTLAAAPGLAQSSAGSGYDRAAEKAISGTITGVDAYIDNSGAVGVHIEVDTGRGLVFVHLGPAIFIGQNNFSFLRDEKVSVIGAPAPGTSALWARTIAKDSTMLVLRNEDGTPKWAPAINGLDGCGVNHPPLPAATTDK